MNESSWKEDEADRKRDPRKELHRGIRRQVSVEPNSGVGAHWDSFVHDVGENSHNEAEHR